MIFISFIEEGIMNPKYYGYTGGRVEVHHPGNHYASEELRFFTHNLEAFLAFREYWDFRYLSKKEYERFKEELKVFQD